MTQKRTAFLGGVLLLAAAVTAAALGRDDARAGTQLVKGWNNIAYTGATGDPATALAEISGKYEAVYRWNALTQQYEVYGPGLPSFANSLTTIRPGDSIWISLTANSGQLSGSVAAGGTGSGRISIAASTFQPASDLAVYDKSFNQLAPVGTDVESQRYYAPVIIPDGAVILSMTVAFEASGGQVQARLDYTPLGNGSNASQIFKLAEVLSSSGASPQTVQAYSHTVDNGANVYFLVVDLTGGPGTKLKGVSIAYAGS